jgi:hypothetical protein
MKYLRRQNLNVGNILDDTVLQRADGNVELNPTQKVIINGDLEFGPGSQIPGPEVTNVLYVTVDGDDNNSGLGEGPGQAKRTLKAALEAADQGATIFIHSGEYYEDNPLRVPPKVSIIGDNLRRVIIRPLNGPQSADITFVSKINEYVTLTTEFPHGLNVGDRLRVRVQLGAVVNATDIVPGNKYKVLTTGNSDFTLIGSLANKVNDVFRATAVGVGTGTVQWVEVDDDDVNILEVPSPTTLVYRQAGADVSSISAVGKIKWAPDLFLVNSQAYLNGMVFKGLAAPAYCLNIDSDAIVDTSPYIQNCSNINGPWLKNGVEWLPFITEQPDAAGNPVTGPRPLLDDEIDPAQLDLYGIDDEGAGGGMLIDGDRYSSESPIKSMVADAFTQVAQGAIGFHITNFGYMQLVSCFSVFCKKAFYTTRGGYLSISNSVIDFGDEGFVADGYYPDPYGTGVINQDYYSSVASINVTPGAGYSAVPTVLIEPPTTPGGVTAEAEASIDPILGIVNAITITEPGSGYDFQPAVTIFGGGSPTAIATGIANLQKNLFIDVFELSNKPQIGSLMFLGDDPTSYYVIDVANSDFTFKYDEQKCRRDVGIILDAVLADVVFDSNHRSVSAGLAYLRSYSSKVTSLQKSQTIDGLTEAKTQAIALTSNPTAIARITAGFDIVIDIITLGLSAAPTIVNTVPATYEPGYAEASTILLANKQFIEDEIIEWIDSNTTFSYDEAKCRRDVEIIIKAVLGDVILGSNYQTVVAGLSYLRSYSVNVTSLQKAQTIAGLLKARDLANSLINDPATINAITTRFQTIVDIIDSEDATTAPTITMAQPVGGDSGYVNAAAQLIANKSFIVEELISYINENLSPGSIVGYDEDVCRRDAEYLVDAIRFDILYGGNSATTVAANSYLNGLANVVGTQITEHVAVYGRLKSFIDNIILGTTAGWTPSSTNTETQNISGAAGSVAAATSAENLVQIIVDVISTGSTSSLYTEPTYSLGVNFIFRNDDRITILDDIEVIKYNTIQFLNSTYGNFNYNEATCRRDIRYIVDAMCYDLMYGGNTQTINAALAYKEGSVIAGEVEETKAAYEYWKSIVGKILKNQVVDTDIPGQVTNLPLGFPIDAEFPTVSAENLLQIIVDVLDNGPGYIPEVPTQPTYSIGDSILLIERNSILENTLDIQEQVINYLNNTYGGSSRVYTFPPILSVEEGVEPRFYNVSTISTGGTALEYVGSGVTYNSLPFFGGEPIATKERVERNGGKCFTVSNDQIGNFKVGEFFTVNALSGEITIDAEKLNLSGLASIGPFRRNGVPVGVQLREVSNNANLISSTGSADVNTVPTQPAVRTYVENRYLNKVASGAQTVESDVAFIRDVEIRGGDITTNQTTFNLLNTTATTVNAFGAGTTINVGSSTGTLTINNSKVVLNSTTSLQIPVGNVSQRPSPTALGQIRYNNELSTFEGYGPGGAWGSLGGVRSVDGLTQITAESAPGASDDILRFYAADIDNITSKLVMTLNNQSLVILNATQSTDKDTGAVIVEGGVGIEKNLNVGGTLAVTGNTTLTADLAVNGGDLTTNQTTFNLLNDTATTVNFAGAATTLEIGAATGTTNINNNLEVDGDVTIDGGDLIVSTTTFNLANTTATTLNIGNAATSIVMSAATGTTQIRNNLTVNGDVNIDGGDLTVSTAAFNLVNTNATTVNFAGAATITNIGSTSGNTNVKNNFNVDINSTLGLNTDSLNVFNGKFTANLKDNTGDIFTVKENTNNYININTNNGLEFITFGLLPKYEFLNTTDATSATVASTTFAGGVGIAKKLIVGTDLNVNGNATLGDATTDAHAVNGTLIITAPDNTAAAIQIRENAQPYFTVVTTNGSESVTFESTPRVLISNTTDSTDKDTGALVIEGGVGIEKNLSIGLNLAIDGDLAVNGGDITTTASTFNLINANATTVNFAGAGTAITIGATTGTTTIRNANTVVTGDLAVNGGDITSSAVTVNILAATSTTVNAFGAATALNLGAATGITTVKNNLEVDLDTVLNGTLQVDLNATIIGDLEVRGGDLTTNQTTFNLLNASATTVNFAGAATTIEIGAATGTTNVNNDLDVDGSLTAGASTLSSVEITSTTASTSTTTGALTVVGGVGVGGDLWVGKSLSINSEGTSGSAIQTIYSPEGFGGDILFRSGGTLTGIIGVSPNGADINSYVSNGIRLLNNGVAGLTVDSSNIVRVLSTAASTSATTGALRIAGGVGIAGALNTNGYAHIGLTSSGSLLRLGGPAGEAYFDAGKSELGIWWYSPTSSSFTISPTGLLTEGIKINDLGNVIVQPTTASTSNTTGALTVVGGVGIAGNLYVGGDIATSNTGTFNLLATNTTGINFGSVATAIEIGAATGSTNINHDLIVDGDLQVKGGDLTTNQTTFNLLSTTATTINFGGAATTINIGNSTTVVNVGELRLTTDLEVQYGGTGRSTFTENGVIYGNTADGLLVTAASNPGSNATTSYGILTTDINNVPVWTDVIDGGSY